MVFRSLAVLAVALPFLLAGSVPPTSTYFNQAIAFGGCGLWLLARGLTPVGVAAAPVPVGTRLVSVAGLLLVVSTLTSGAPWGQRLAPLACLLLAGALMHAAASAARAGRTDDWIEPLMHALLLAGVLSVAIGLVQVFLPERADGLWVAFPTTPGRAIGNMRQPNQLSTLLLWASAAAVWLGRRERHPPAWLAALLALLVFGVTLTASRTGTVGVVLLALWGLADRRLPKSIRWTLVAMLPFHALCWAGLDQWMSTHGMVFYGEDQVRKTLHGDASSSRGRIWADTWTLIRSHPWTGVGVGAFNFIWSMTPLPQRPVAFFDHSHNLVLQLAVESGVPLAGAVLLLTGVAAWRSRAGWLAQDEERACSARAVLFMLVLAGVHSMLEYPLWYVYFLLPAAIMAGWLTGSVPPAASGPTGATPAREMLRRAAWTLAGVAALAGTAVSTSEYASVAVIFEPGWSAGEPAPLATRIERGRRSVLWGHHADYAEVTMAPEPEKVFDAFDRPLHHLADTRLLMAYARALAARGELDRAAHVAARLREFRNPMSSEFLAVCEGRAQARGEVPFQCLPDPGLPAAALRPAAGR